MKTNIGGDRLGSGNKQEVSMRNYERSTHDLSYVWRSSMAPGTLVPFMSVPALPGDTFDINLNCEVLTLPTVGPLFGSFKVQLDVFQVPIRLYNARLHMNELGIGLKMSDIKLPLIGPGAYIWGSWEEYLDDSYQVHPSSLLKYLGISGIGRPGVGVDTGDQIIRYFNAIPFLGYWDIYKQYYANKQEPNGKCIHWQADAAYLVPQSARQQLGIGVGWRSCLGDNQSLDFDPNQSSLLEIDFGTNTDEPDPSTVTLYWDGASAPLTDFYDDFEWNDVTMVLSCFNPSVQQAVTNYYVGLEPAQPIDLDNRQAIQVFDFPLENIDNMRKLLLRWDQDTVAPVIGRTTGFVIHPYSLYRTLVQGNIGNKTASQFSQEQLALKTYQSDLHNNWISTEWIDGPNGINEITSVDTTGDSFTIDALNLAKKVYVMLNRIAISGGTYDDWLDAVYTHERRRGTENPVYMGSLIKELSFQEVVSQADTTLDSNLGGFQPMGKLAGRGRLTDKNKGGQVKVKVDEPSYIMGIVSITPRIDYSQSNDWSLNLLTMDDFHKPALDAIGYQDLVTDQMAWQDTIVDVDQNVTYNSVGKQPAWINYMTAVNKVYGNFADRKKDMFMTLTRRYNYTELGISDFTTYVDPSLFNFIFAKTSLDSQNFWVQIANNITARRKMSAKVIPNL